MYIFKYFVTIDCLVLNNLIQKLNWIFILFHSKNVPCSYSRRRLPKNYTNQNAKKQSPNSWGHLYVNWNDSGIAKSFWFCIQSKNVLILLLLLLSQSWPAWLIFWHSRWFIFFSYFLNLRVFFFFTN